MIETFHAETLPQLINWAWNDPAYAAAAAAALCCAVYGGTVKGVSAARITGSLAARASAGAGRMVVRAFRSAPLSEECLLVLAEMGGPKRALTKGALVTGKVATALGPCGCSILISGSDNGCGVPVDLAKHLSRREIKRIERRAQEIIRELAIEEAALSKVSVREVLQPTQFGKA